MQPCAVAAYEAGAGTTPACVWTFETIALERSAEDDGAAGAPGRLRRAGFATSTLTIEETVARLSEGAAALLPWDRQAGIARELALAMGIGVDGGSLRSPHFLLMPAVFNEAYLADFIDFVACQTAHTFIFAGALDGRGDAPYVTRRWSAMKVPICLEIEGADCSAKHLRYEPARMYFRMDYPCLLSPRRD
jgi:hypothetical protein